MTARVEIDDLITGAKQGPHRARPAMPRLAAAMHEHYGGLLRIATYIGDDEHTVGCPEVPPFDSIVVIAHFVLSRRDFRRAPVHSVNQLN
jgi:hypothetical protein